MITLTEVRDSDNSPDNPYNGCAWWFSIAELDNALKGEVPEHYRRSVINQLKHGERAIIALGWTSTELQYDFYQIVR